MVVQIAIALLLTAAVVGLVLWNERRIYRIGFEVPRGRERVGLTDDECRVRHDLYGGRR